MSKSRLSDDLASPLLPCVAMATPAGGIRVEAGAVPGGYCRCTGNQGTQTCLSAAHVAFLVRPGRAQLIDQLLKTLARGPALARRTTKTSSGSGLT